MAEDTGRVTLEVHARLQELHAKYVKMPDRMLPAESFRKKLQKLGWVAREDERMVTELLEALENILPMVRDLAARVYGDDAQKILARTKQYADAKRAIAKAREEAS